jgi:hypothetical protein
VGEIRAGFVKASQRRPERSKAAPRRGVGKNGGVVCGRVSALRTRGSVLATPTSAGSRIDILFHAAATNISSGHRAVVNRMYKAATVKLTVKRRTRGGLLRMGRRRGSNKDEAERSYLRLSRNGWTHRNARFEYEDEVLNIGLGQGDARDYFNRNSIEWEVVRP